MHTEAQIKSIADTLLPGFLPKSPDQKELTFHFTIPPNHSYKVRYEKDAKDKWVFAGYEQAEN